MLNLSELENLEQLWDNELLYSHFLSFSNLISGDFAILDNSSKTLLMNQSALQAINMSLHEIVGHDYFSYRSKIIELASDFFNRDQACKSRNSKILTISWGQYGENSQWDLSLATRTPIYGMKNKVIGLSNHVIPMTDILLGPLSQFFKRHKLDNFFGFTEAFAIEVSSTYPHLNLSVREVETLFFLLYGKTSKEIASILNLSMRTIESYVENIKNKLNCNTKSQLIEKGLSAGYLGIFPETLFKKIAFK